MVITPLTIPNLSLIDLDHRGQTVGGAGGIGNDVVLGRVVHVIVHAQHNRQILTLGRGGDDHFLGAALDDMGLRPGILGGIAENAGGFDHDLDAQVFPGQVTGVALGEDLDVLPSTTRSLALTSTVPWYLP